MSAELRAARDRNTLNLSDDDLDILKSILAEASDSDSERQSSVANHLLSRIADCDVRYPITITFG